MSTAPSGEANEVARRVGHHLATASTDDLPAGCDEADIACMTFWAENPGAAGGGSTPTRAYAALTARLLP